MDILVIGAGAVGSLVGAKLALAGHSTTLVGRPRFVAEMSGQGLRLLDAEGVHVVKGITPVASIHDAFARDVRYDFAVMAVKSFDTAAAVAELTASTSDGLVPPVVSLQNGVGNEERIADALGPARVIAGVIATPVSTRSPTGVQVEKPDYSVGLSRWHPAVSSATFAAVQRAFGDAGFSVSEYPDADGMKWTKLLMNMVGNASCAILDMPPSELFSNKALADLEISAWREALAVLRAGHIRPVNFGSYPLSLLAPLIRTLPAPILRRSLRKAIGDARGGKMPSLYMDLESGRTKSEVGWLNGAVVRTGVEHGVLSPVNRMLTDVLMRLVEEPSERELWRRNPARLLATAAEYHAVAAGSST